MDSHQILVTFVSAAVLGIFLILLSDRLKVSAIVLLLVGGIFAGPSFLGFVHPEALGEGLNSIISIAVGLILFEGGLTLDIKGYRQVSGEILGVLTRGVVVTWGVTSVLVYLIFGFDPVFCILSGSLIIVTGPTVIGPLLQRVRVKKNLHQILYWEGVLIDPIGVFIALLCYEWILTAGAQGAYINFISRILVGLGVGFAFGWVVNLILRKDWVKEERINIFVLSTAMLNLMVADMLVQESGLLSVTMTGLYLGYKKAPRLASIIAYKVELKDLLIGLLFILLAAHLNLDSFTGYGNDLLWVLLGVLFLVRPLNIFISTLGSKLTIKEKLFLSWVAPRGIVAASMASLFAFQLGKNGVANSSFLETFTYTVIAGTVIFQGFTAKIVGRFLGVLQTRPTGWLIVGSHKLGRAVARFLSSIGKTVIVVDSNPVEIKQANREGLKAVCENAMQMEPEYYVEMTDIGNVLALTANSELNRLVCHRWNTLLDHANLYFWSESDAAEEGGLTKGLQIWPEINIKNILAKNIEQKELITSINDVQLPRVGPNLPGLMFEVEGNVIPFEPDGKGRASMLALRPQEADLLGPTQTSWVTFSSKTNLPDLYEEMLELLDSNSFHINKELLLEDLVTREQEFSSLLGNSIALPHCYDKSLKESIMLVAKLEYPIPLEASNDVIKLVFMVLSPEGQPETHLQQISKIAKFIIQEENRAAMLSALNPIELFHILEQWDIKG